MKHRVFFAAVLLLLICSSAFAATQTFSEITVEVPDGWTAEEDEHWVWLRSQTDSSARIGIYVAPKEDHDTRYWANYWYDQMAASDSWFVSDYEEALSENDNSFYYATWEFALTNVTGEAVVFDSTLDYRIGDNEYCMILLTENAIDTYNNIINESLVFKSGPSATHKGDETIIDIKNEGFPINKKTLAMMALAGGGCSTAGFGLPVMCLTLAVFMLLTKKGASIMKRSLICTLILALVLTVSAGFASAQDFTYMSFTVPSGWTASEADSGIVTITNNSDTSDRIIFQLAALGTSTLQSVANSYYSNLGGTGEIGQGTTGYYFFSGINNSGTRFFHTLDDHSTDSKVPEGYYWWSCFTQSGTAFDVFIDYIYDNLTFYSSSPSPSPTSSDYTGSDYTGTVQTFSRMSVKVPSGYTATEDEGVVIITSNSDSTAYIMLAVNPTNGGSLSELASYYSEIFGGSTPERNSSAGWYKFTFTNNNGNTVTVYLDDSTTSPQVPSGYCWLQLVTNKVTSDVWPAILSTVTFTVQGTSQSEGSSGGTSSGYSGTVQTFSRMSVKVPSGYTAKEDGSVVTITSNSDSKAYMMFAVNTTGGKTLEELAHLYSSRFDGATTPERNSSAGWYKFTFTNNNGNTVTVYLDDSTTSPQVPSGYCWIQLATDQVTSDIWPAILNTVTFTVQGTSQSEGSSGGTSSGYSGTVQTFSRMSVKVPSGYTASESGSVVTITSNSDSKVYMMFDVNSTNGSSLSELARSYSERFGGSTPEKNSSAGWYKFTYTDKNGSTVTVFIDDSTTSSQVPSGYCWIQLVTNQVTSDIWPTILNTVSIFGSNRTGITDDTQTVRTQSQNKTTVIVQRAPQNQTVVRQEGGGGGGCSSGIGTFALLAALAAFMTRKIR